VVFLVFRGAPFRTTIGNSIQTNMWRMPELYTVRLLSEGARSASARASARSASWCRNLLAAVESATDSSDVCRALIQRHSDKKIPSIQLDICDGSSTSDNGAVPLSSMMRALTSS
jgi:hypothetical protein